MQEFRFYHPIEVRYGDLDPQGHVNNARYLTYMEQARVAYVRQLGLWDGGSFFNFGLILADVHVAFLKPIYFDQKIQVGVRVSRIGNKSLTMEYSLIDQIQQELAVSESILVAFDYHRNNTVPVPDHWRRTIIEFEGLEDA